MGPIEIGLTLFPWFFVSTVGLFIFFYWKRERRLDREMQHFELSIQREREKEEAERRERERDNVRYERYTQKQKEEEDKIRNQAGGGTGGYIILDLPDAQRGLFQDL
ncbi:MAG: hypothetical protein ABI618_17115, partial [Nitrospirota bacterium]